MIRRISKIIRNVTELVLYSVTVIAAAALICAYLASAVDPASNTFFIPFGLAAPFIIGLNLLLALFWIIRWKPIAFLPVLLLAIGYGVVSRHIQLPVLKQYEKRTSATSTSPRTTFTYSATQTGTAPSTVSQNISKPQTPTF